MNYRPLRKVAWFTVADEARLYVHAEDLEDGHSARIAIKLDHDHKEDMVLSAICALSMHLHTRRLRIAGQLYGNKH